MMLKAEIQAEILSLHYGEGKSARTIAKALGINRRTVARVIARRAVQLTPKAQAKRDTLLDAYRSQIDELMLRDPFIAAVTVHQRIREMGFIGGLTILRDYMKKKRQARSKPREAFLKLEFASGQAAQVDWGEFGNVFGDEGKIHCFVMVLCYSRMIYIEFTRSEKFETFIRCHENAFKYFGGRVPLECWYDNLASAVTDRVGGLVRFNARFMQYLGHHVIRPHACNPARGNEKGRVEDGVKYIRSSFWAGRHFKDFSTLTYQAGLWRDNIANQREHRSTRKIPRLVFEGEEKLGMRPMNPHPFDTAEIFSRVINNKFHIPYETNEYSVPWTLVGMSVTVRVTDIHLVVFYKDRCVTKHTRSYRRHQVFTLDEHKRGLLERKPGMSSKNCWQVDVVKSMGAHMSRYLSLIESGSRSLRSELSQILALATVFGESQVNACAAELLEGGIVGVENLERLLKTKQLQLDTNELLPKPIQFQNQKLNRIVPSVDLSRYDMLVTAVEEPTNTGDTYESK